MAATKMAGRGRGFRRLDVNEGPLRRPGTLPVATLPNEISPSSSSEIFNSSDRLSEPPNINHLSLSENVERPSVNLNGSLDDKLRTLGLSGEEPTFLPKATTVAKFVVDNISSEDDLKALVRAVVHYGIRGKQQSCIAGQLVEELRAFQCGKLKFLVEYMNQIQKFFEASSPEEEPQFPSYLTLLCDTFYYLGVGGRNPIIFVKEVILRFFVILLARGGDLEISTVTEQILKLTNDLSSKETSDLMVVVRKNIVSSKCSAKSRSQLLHLLELYLNDWKALDKNVERFYDEF